MPLFFWFFLCLCHSFSLKKSPPMSSRFTQYQATPNSTAISHGGINMAPEASRTTTFTLDDDSPISTSFGSELYTPFAESSLLSPPSISSPMTNTLGAEIRPIAMDSTAYIRHVQECKLLRN